MSAVISPSSPAVDLVALDAAKQAAFTRDLLALIERDNLADDGTLMLPSEYLEVVIGRS